MKFHTKKKHVPTITIVALVDVLAILLIFFMVTTTFRQQEPSLQIKLPDSSTAEAAAGGSTEPIFLSVKGEQEITLDNQKVSLANLSSELQKLVAANPKRPVALRADRDAPFGVVVGVLDALKLAGIKNIPTFTQPKKAP